VRRVAHERTAARILRLVLALSLVSAGWCVSGSVGLAQTPPDAMVKALYVAADGRYAEMITAIEQAGGHVLHAFPPSAAIATSEYATLQRLAAAGLARYATTGPLNPDAVNGLAPRAGLAAAAWQALVEPPVAALGSADGATLAGDAFEPPDLDGLSAFALDPNLYQQSDFLTGKVVVNLVLVESDGTLDANTEDWTADERELVFSEIVSATSWWQALEPRAHLEFIYDDHYSQPVPVQYEPISRPHSDERLWVSQAMQRLGFSASSYITAVRQRNQDSRLRYGADWAFTIFVVDSSNDLDNRFPDGYFAYAYIYGPFMVLTYGNNGYGPSNMDAVTAHEMGHIFGALDEYASANVPATAIGGYLGVPNGNSQVGGSSDVDCIMRGGLAPFVQRRVCPYTAGQVGWRDSDGDGILDPLDTSLSMGASLTEGAGGLTLSAIATDTPYPSTTRTPISTNRLARADYRVGEGPRRLLDAADGSVDSSSEQFSVELPTAPQGAWEIEVRAIDSAGNVATDVVRLEIAQGSVAESANVQGALSADGGTMVFSGLASVSAEAGAVQVVEYSLDLAGWQAAAPGDGAYDSNSEVVALAFASLTSGSHSLRVRAWATSPWAQPEVWEQSLVIEGSGADPIPLNMLYLPISSLSADWH